MPEEKKMRYGKCNNCFYFNRTAGYCTKHNTDVTEHNGCYGFIEAENAPFDEINLSLDLYKRDGLFGVWLSDSIGGSGIGLEGMTIEGVAEHLKSYIIDYFYRLENKDNDV